MSLRRCEMRWLLLLAGGVQTRLNNRCDNVSYFPLLDTLPTYCSQPMVLNHTEAPPIDQNVSGL